MMPLAVINFANASVIASVLAIQFFQANLLRFRFFRRYLCYSSQPSPSAFFYGFVANKVIIRIDTGGVSLRC
jgi:hypothetical protein